MWESIKNFFGFGDIQKKELEKKAEDEAHKKLQEELEKANKILQDRMDRHNTPKELRDRESKTLINAINKGKRKK